MKDRSSAVTEINQDPAIRLSAGVFSRAGAVTVCLLMSSAVYLLFLHHGFAPAVVGYNLAPAERVLNGEVPYRDFLYNYTPGVLWLNALLFKSLGATLITARVGVLAAKVSTTVLLFLLARRYMSGWVALLPVIMTLAWIGYGDVLKVFPTQFGMPFLLASCLSMLRSHEASSGRTRILWLLFAGGLSGLVFVFKQNVGVFTLAAALSSALFLQMGSLRSGEDRGRLKRGLILLSVVVAGFAAAAVWMFAYLWAKSALLPMASHFTKHAAAYSEAKAIALPSPILLIPSLVAAAILVVTGHLLKKAGLKTGVYTAMSAALLFLIIAAGNQGPGGSLYRSLVAQVYYLPLYLVFASAIWLIVVHKAMFGKPTFKSKEVLNSGSAPVAFPVARTATLVLFSLAAFLEIFPRSDPDHLIRVLPPSLVLMCAAVFWGEDRALVSRRSHDFSEASSKRARLPIVLVSCLVAGLGVRVTWLPQLDEKLHFREGTQLRFERGRGVGGAPDEAGGMNEIVAYVQSQTGPADAIFAISRKMSAVYFLASRPNRTRLLWFDSAGVSQADRELVERMISNKKFKLVLVGGDPEQGLFTSDENALPAYRDALELLSQNYQIAAVIRGVTVFAPRA